MKTNLISALLLALTITFTACGPVAVPPNTPIDQTDYIGMSVEAAKSLAATYNVPFRVVKEDGQALPITMDYRPGRVNATVENGLVIGYSVEGQESESTDEYDANSWESMIPETCISYFDGCNTCHRDLETGLAGCTKKACQQYEMPACLDDEA